VSDRIEGMRNVMQDDATQPERIRSVKRIVVGEDIRLVGLRDLRVDTQELIGRRIVVAVDSAISWNCVKAGE
jgi:hypothetical protein